MYLSDYDKNKTVFEKNISSDGYFVICNEQLYS